LTVVASYAPTDLRETAVHPTITDPGPLAPGAIRILDEKGQPLSVGFAAVSGDRMLVRGLNPSGAVATAYFGRQQRRFRLEFDDGTTRMASMRSCRWQDGERVCEFTVYPQRAEPAAWDGAFAAGAYTPGVAAFSRN
jgi:hypothetical protein